MGQRHFPWEVTYFANINKISKDKIFMIPLKEYFWTNNGKRGIVIFQEHHRSVGN